MRQSYEVEVLKTSGVVKQPFTRKADAYAFAREQSKHLDCMVCDIRVNGKLIQTYYKGRKKLWN